MQSIIDRLPPEIANQLHPDRRKNEEGYWAARDELLKQYKGEWIGFADGRVVASGTRPVTVFHASEATGLHPFFICVGREEQPFRIRSITFPYDSTYPGEPMPQIAVEFRPASGSPAVQLDRVIPDTGADTTVLPWVDCQQMQLVPALGMQSQITGVGGTMFSLGFSVVARIEGQDYPCLMQVDFAGNERILGRDVLNELEILFRGPGREVVINP